MRAQHTTFNKILSFKIIFCLIALLKVVCWALIFIKRIHFQPGKSLAMTLNLFSCYGF